MVDARHFEQLQLLYLNNRWSYRAKVLHGDAQRRSASYQKFRIWFILKIQDGERCANIMTID